MSFFTWIVLFSWHKVVTRAVKMWCLLKYILSRIVRLVPYVPSGSTCFNLYNTTRTVWCTDPAWIPHAREVWVHGRTVHSVASLDREVQCFWHGMKCKLVHSLCFLSAWPFGPPFTLTLFDSIQSTFDLRLKEGWFGLGFVTVAAFGMEVAWFLAHLAPGQPSYFVLHGTFLDGPSHPRSIHDAKNSQYFRNFLAEDPTFLHA